MPQTERNEAEDAVIRAARLLAVAADKTCRALEGDKVVDGLQAALSAFCDAYDDWAHR